jgi:hypothetical protein
MADQLSFGNDARRFDISLQNDTVSAAQRQHLSIPRQGTDTGWMTLQFFNLLVGRNVPNLNISVIRSYGNQISLRTKNQSVFGSYLKKVDFYSLIPSDGSDWVCVAREITESGDLAGESGPQVDATAEADAQHILRRPVDEVEVEIVLKFRHVQHFDFRPQQLVFEQTCVSCPVFAAITLFAIFRTQSISVVFLAHRIILNINLLTAYLKYINLYNISLKP